jgi:hypothetical protein
MEMNPISESRHDQQWDLNMVNFTKPLQTMTKAGNLIKGGNADRGFFNKSNFYVLCPAPNI